MAIVTSRLDPHDKQFRGLWQHVIEFEAYVDPPSVGSNATVSETVTIPGVELGDVCFVSVSQDTQTLIIQGNVSAANTVRILFANTSAGAIDLGTIDLHVIVMRPFHKEHGA